MERSDHGMASRISLDKFGLESIQIGKDWRFSHH